MSRAFGVSAEPTGALSLGMLPEQIELRCLQPEKDPRPPPIASHFREKEGYRMVTRAKRRFPTLII